MEVVTNRPSVSPLTILSRSPTAWGKVGFALWADDYMQNVYNHYGIRETILMVDDKQVFRSDVYRIPVFSNRQVNAWGDYHHWLHNKTWYMRSFIPEGVTLPILQADENNGYVLFSEERPYQFTYILRDFMGNESRYTFTVMGKKCPVAPLSASRCNVRYDRLSLISLPGMQLTIPAGMVQEGLTVIPKVDQCECLQTLYLLPTALSALRMGRAEHCHPRWCGYLPSLYRQRGTRHGGCLSGRLDNHPYPGVGSQL